MKIDVRMTPATIGFRHMLATLDWWKIPEQKKTIDRIPITAELEAICNRHNPNLRWKLAVLFEDRTGLPLYSTSLGDQSNTDYRHILELGGERPRWWREIETELKRYARSEGYMTDEFKKEFTAAWKNWVTRIDRTIESTYPNLEMRFIHTLPEDSGVWDYDTACIYPGGCHWIHGQYIRQAGLTLCIARNNGEGRTPMGRMILLPTASGRAWLLHNRYEAGKHQSTDYGTIPALETIADVVSAKLTDIGVTHKTAKMWDVDGRRMEDGMFLNNGNWVFIYDPECDPSSGRSDDWYVTPDSPHGLSNRQYRALRHNEILSDNEVKLHLKTECLDQDGIPCQNCGERVNEDEMYRNPHNGDMYCESCYGELFLHCESCCEDYPNEDVSEVNCRRYNRWSTRMVCDGCRRDNYTECGNGEYYPDDMVTEASDGTMICPEHGDFEDYVYSEYCEVYTNDPQEHPHYGVLPPNCELDGDWVICPNTGIAWMRSDVYPVQHPAQILIPKVWGRIPDEIPNDWESLYDALGCPDTSTYANIASH